MRDILLQQGREEYAACLNLSEPIHQVYAERHGLKYLRIRGPVLVDWTGHWDALPLILALMTYQDANWVYWVDADALIVGDADIRQALPTGAELGMCRHPGPPEHWNCGVMFAQNTARVRDWLHEVLIRGPGVYPWYQQAIMNDQLEREPFAGMCTQLDDRWNSTVVLHGPDDCEIRAWHAIPGGGAARARFMARAIEARGL